MTTVINIHSRMLCTHAASACCDHFLMLTYCSSAAHLLESICPDLVPMFAPDPASIVLFITSWGFDAVLAHEFILEGGSCTCNDLYKHNCFHLMRPFVRVPTNQQANLEAFTMHRGRIQRIVVLERFSKVMNHAVCRVSSPVRCVDRSNR